MTMTDLPAAFTVPSLLTVAQAGQVLGCSVRTVRRRIAAGELPAVIEHDRTMVRGDELAEYIENLGRAVGTLPRRKRPPKRHDFSFLSG